MGKPTNRKSEMPQKARSKTLILNLLKEKPKGTRGTLIHIARETIKKKKKLSYLAAKHKTPLYIIDEKKLISDIRKFKRTFDAYLPRHEAFYAVKANYHPYILKKMVKEGMGLDVSSKRELLLAIQAGAKKILFSGPGKSEEDIEFAIKHGGKIIINMDSFEELHRIGRITNKEKITAKTGIRFSASVHGAWSKFGIPMEKLRKFWDMAEQYPYIMLQGLHFHTSQNLHAERYVRIIKELATYLKRDISPKRLKQIKYIDIGGGYYPDNVEGFYPWSHYYPWTLSGGYISKLAHEYHGEKIEFHDKYYITRASPLKRLGQEIGQAIHRHLENIVSCAYYTEPGRIVVNGATYIITEVVDIKDGAIITNTGINATGWEFGQHLYLPLVNVTHHDLKEKKIKIYGPLCTPRDIWGYYIYAKTIAIGDIIAIPNQGAYKFTLAQNFIRDIPPTFIMR